MQTIDALLREVPLFEGLGDDQLELIAGCGSNAAFDEDEKLFREGEHADRFYLVRQGRVALETFVPTKGPITIETVDAGDLVGWSWLFPPYLWQFDARAVTRLRVTAFDGACLRRKCEEDPVLGYALMLRFAQVMVERLQWTRVRLLDLYGDRRPV